MKSTRLINFGLVVVSTTVALLLVEWLVFPKVVPHLSLSHQGYLSKLRVLAQSSKAAMTPKDYIALVGDSYAQGRGDWLLESDPDGNGPFHSAHVLRDLSGRDVISFGKGGTGSLEGMVERPLKQFRYIAGSPWFALEPPRTILAYFYEGNDFDNNIRTLREAGLILPDGTILGTAAAIETLVAERTEGGAVILGAGLAPAFSFSVRALIGTYKWVSKNALEWGLKKIGRGTQKVRRCRTGSLAPNGDILAPSVALLDGKRFTLCDRLQGPSLELTEPEVTVSALLLKKSLAALRDAFPASEIVVVYLSSPLGTYRLVSQTVNIQSHQKRQLEFPAEAVAVRSNQLCRMVREAAATTGAGFLDTRPALREVAESQAVHGPRDWGHYNRLGYETLALAIYDYLKAGEPAVGDCAAI